VNIEIGQDREIFDDELFGCVAMRRIALQNSRQNFDLLVVEVVPDEQRVVGDLAEVHQHPDAAVHSVGALQGSLR